MKTIALHGADPDHGCGRCGTVLASGAPAMAYCAIGAAGSAGAAGALARRRRLRRSLPAAGRSRIEPPRLRVTGEDRQRQAGADEAGPARIAVVRVRRLAVPRAVIMPPMVAAAKAAQGTALAALDQDDADHRGGDQEMDDEENGNHDDRDNSATRPMATLGPAACRPQAPAARLVDGPEACRIQARPADQHAGDARHGHDLAGIVGLDRAAVEDRAPARRSSASAPGAADRGVARGDVGRAARPAGADRPDRLVGDDEPLRRGRRPASCR